MFNVYRTSYNVAVNREYSSCHFSCYSLHLRDPVCTSGDYKENIKNDFVLPMSSNQEATARQNPVCSANTDDYVCTYRAFFSRAAPVSLCNVGYRF